MAVDIALPLGLSLLLINDIPFCRDPIPNSGLNVALGPSSFDKFSNTPAAACIEFDSAVDEAFTVEVVLALALALVPVVVAVVPPAMGSFLTADDDVVVESINGEVILLNPGAN